jgi:type II secretory pathway pseudopilin PulG
MNRPDTSSQTSRRPASPLAARRALTLVELLTAMGVLAILLSLLLGGLFVTKRKAVEANCASNLRQFGLAIIAYRSDNRDRVPPWLSSLHPDYLKGGLGVFLCGADRAKPKGTHGSKPDGEIWVGDQYEETDDNNFRKSTAPPAPERNPTVAFNSYMYEFSAARCDWWQCNSANPCDCYLVTAPFNPGDPCPPSPTASDLDKNRDGVVSWGDVKHWQLEHGDRTEGSRGQPYSAATFPIVRCFWHATPYLGPSRTKPGEMEWHAHRVLNLSYDGRVFISDLQWEGTSR